MMKSVKILAILLVVLWIGCGKKKGPTQGEQLRAYIDAGWAEYAAGEFSDALE